ncbi:hypothetical protein [Vibrio nigripulchritudo]|uniref:hypothetical protein n=1 Tax=Vibrio nigripulchritudo TaxID=28173 RepID=UPI00130EB17E|nr:hypothetical protein [Vibrio nigripulchritudo]
MEKLSRFFSESQSYPIPKNTIILKTCHRVEYYSRYDFTPPKLPNYLNSSWQEVKGEKEVFSRIARIIFGVDSVIVGEDYITSQCRLAFMRSVVSDFPYKKVDKIINSSKCIREKHDFFTSFNYHDAAFRILSTYSKKENLKNLVIFGGGMLGQRIAKSSKNKNYKNITLVTSQPTRFIKSLKGLSNFNIKVISYKNLSLPSEYDCILATDNLSKEKKKIIFSKINNRERGSTVDFCSIPISDKYNDIKGNYCNIHSDFFLELVDLENSTLLSKVHSIESEIDTLVRNTLLENNG